MTQAEGPPHANDAAANGVAAANGGPPPAERSEPAAAPAAAALAPPPPLAPPQPEQQQQHQQQQPADPPPPPPPQPPQPAEPAGPASKYWAPRGDAPDAPGFSVLQSAPPRRPGAVTVVRFSPDGALLAAGDEAGWVALFPAGEAALPGALRGAPAAPAEEWCAHATAGINDLAWSRDARFVATASNELSVRVREVGPGAERALAGHTHWVTSVAFVPAGNVLASASMDETVRLWDVQNARCIKVVPAHSDPVCSLDVAGGADAPLLLSASFDGLCRLWTLGTPLSACLLPIEAPRRDGAPDPPAFTSARFAPNGKLALLSTSDSRVVLYRVDTRRVVATYAGHACADHFASAAFFKCEARAGGAGAGAGAPAGGAPPPQQRYVAAASEDHHVYIYDLKSGALVGLLRGRPHGGAPGGGHAGPVLCVDAHPRLALLASAGADGAVTLWQWGRR